MDHYLIRYFKTEEHSDADADEWVQDKFYSEIHYTTVAEDLMLKQNYFRIEIYINTNRFTPVKTFMLSKFDRTNYFKNNK